MMLCRIEDTVRRARPSFTFVRTKPVLISHILVCLIYVFSFEIQLSEGSVGITLISLPPPHCYACPTRQDLDFQRHMSWFIYVQ